MITLVIILHVLVCFIMIGVVLLQSGKGAEIGAAFGGSSQTIFGSRGPGTFLSKMTVAAAVVFMLTSMVLSVVSGTGSISSRIKAGPAEEAPMAPAAPGNEVPPILPPDMPADQPAAPAQGAAPPPDSGTPSADSP